MLIKVLLFVLLIPVTALAEVQLEAPTSVPGASMVKIEAVGEVGERDFVTIVEPDFPETRYMAYQYFRKKSSLELEAPVIPGEYEIRLLKHQTRETLASRPITVTEVTATLTAPDSVKAGAPVKIAWDAPGYKKDYITIVPTDLEEGRYKQYKYVKPGQSVILNAPEVPGTYEIRYATGRDNTTIGRKTLEVTAVTASLEAPDSVTAGQKFSVVFDGPENPKDFVTIVAKDTPERKYGSYKYIKNAGFDKKLDFLAPEDAGEYELRYLSGGDYLTITTRPLVVTATSASLDAPKEVMAGAKFKIAWDGPDNPQDFVTMVKKDEEEGKYSRYVYVKRARPDGKIEFTAYEEPGEYELRYLTGKQYKTLASSPITILAPSASLASPESAEARTRIVVSWEGPGNDRDFIGIAPKGVENPNYRSIAYVKRGKDLRLEVPQESGDYEVHYVTGGKSKVLASNDLNVFPSRVPGRLQVVAAGSEQGNTASGTAVGVILDASGSMLKQEAGKRRIDIAKRALQGLVDSGFDESTSVALRVFGHKEADSCRTDLEVPLAPLNRTSLKGKIESIEAMNLAKTPIAKSLELAKADLAGAQDKRILVLVTDGEETCGGDPRAAIEALVEGGVDTRINIVGFAIDELMLKETFREWARVGNGTYFDARNAEDLERSLKEAIQLPYEVLDTEGQVLAGGVVNGDPIQVLPGTYNVKVLSNPSMMHEQVLVEPEELRVVEHGSSNNLG